MGNKTKIIEIFYSDPDNYGAQLQILPISKIINGDDIIIAHDFLIKVDSETVYSTLDGDH